MRIGEFARAGGVGVETVRYYQRRGLLAEPPRGEGQRSYGNEDVRRLRFIRSAQGAGFTLSEIAVLLSLDAGADRAAARTLARSRIEAIDAKLTELAVARRALSRLADACEREGDGPCPIISAFEH